MRNVAPRHALSAAAKEELKKNIAVVAVMISHRSENFHKNRNTNYNINYKDHILLPLFPPRENIFRIGLGRFATARNTEYIFFQ